MVEWVYRAAKACPQLDRVIVATDADEVVKVCERFGWDCVMTSPELASGTDRVHEVAQSVAADIYVNIQGDEPLVRPEHMTVLLQAFSAPQVEVATLRVRCGEESIANPNAVKVVTAADKRALYFSRSTIPYDRDGVRPQYWKHLGIYAYRAKALRRFPALPPSELEQIERLEQLRFLEAGISIYVETTEFDTVGVDTEDDRVRVEKMLLEREPTR